MATPLDIAVWRDFSGRLCRRRGQRSLHHADPVPRDSGVFRQPAQRQGRGDNFAFDGLFPGDKAGSVDVERLYWSESRLTVGGKL
jgi:hypothetical protein